MLHDTSKYGKFDTEIIVDQLSLQQQKSFHAVPVKKVY